MSAACFRVLLVEDDPHDAELIQRTLARSESPRFQCTSVRKPSAAFTPAQSGNVDVVLLDLNLPDSHGLVGLREIPSAAPRIAVVVLSGVEQETAIQALRNGAED